MFKKVLIANRGEIAVRLIRACRVLGVRSVAIYSEADGQGVWVREADESYPLVGVTARESYLNQAAIFAVAKQAGAEAVHPGYGFLSENADFAEACVAQGLVFIGPSPEAMRRLGSKAEARRLAERVGVPVIPGRDGAHHTDIELKQAASEMGYPVLIKASAGGGGKGMRVVEAAEGFEAALQAARGEAASSFGDDHIILEKFFTSIRHVEIQVLGDLHGNLVHLFERECSVQRRHQKIIEETPSPVVTPDLRQRMTAAALDLARAAGYTSAGTVEFMVTPDGAFYLLEMNTRLQVEHPITELVVVVDLAGWQIRIAGGERLAFSQADLTQRGHALECRLYAEDPALNFLPSIGEIGVYRAPAGPGVRVDDGIATGSAVTPYYDPMLAKIVTWGATRPEAIGKMVQALQETVVLGVTTNVPYLLDILQHEAFVAGETTTHFLAEHFAEWQPSTEIDDELWLAIGALAGLPKGQVALSGEVAGGFDVWSDPAGWRNV